MPTPTDLPTVTITVTALAPFAEADMSYSQDPLTVSSTEIIAFNFSANSTPGLKWINFLPHDTSQFGSVQISDDRTVMSVTDFDTVTSEESIYYSLVFEDAQGKRYNPDPQIINVPR